MKQEIKKEFVKIWNQGDSKSTIIVKLNKKGLSNSEILEVFAEFDIKMSYNMIYNVLTRKGCQMILSGNNKTINKSEMIRKICEDNKGINVKEVVAELQKKDIQINNSMVYSVMKQSGYVKPKKEVREKLTIE
jgi:transposase